MRQISFAKRRETLGLEHPSLLPISLNVFSKKLRQSAKDLRP
jgi:hypothetical protein